MLIFSPQYSSAMKVGLFAMNYATCANPDVAVRIARYAESAGLESLWTGEHVVLPSTPPGGSRLPAELPFLDSVVGLTMLAMATDRIKIGSGIIELPLHNPVLLAKQLASIDQISRGRLIAGFGAGYLEAEFAAVGVALADRGIRMDEHLDVLVELWTSAHPRHQGANFSFDNVDAYPRPLQAGGPPIVLGGTAEPARRRVVTRADGWYLFNADLAIAQDALQIIRAEHERWERKAHLDALEVTVTPVEPLTEDTVRRYEDLGVHRLVVVPDPDASRDDRHLPAREDLVLRTIDRAARYCQ